MPNHSPKVTMGDEGFALFIFKRKPKASPDRRWFCPDDHTIAAYVDGTLEANRPTFEHHLAKCEGCRRAVADVIKLQREFDGTAPLSAAVHTAKQIALTKTRRIRWIWVPACAGAVVAAVIAVGLLQEPARLSLPSTAAPKAPTIAKSIAPLVATTPAQDIVRKPQATDLSPVVISPRPQSVVTPSALMFRWHQILGAHSYSVHVVTADGDPVWEGQTERTFLPLPSKIVLKDGRYFVWVGVDFDDSRTGKSAPIAFQVKN